MKRRTFLCLLFATCCVASASYAKVLSAKAAAGETIQGTVVGIGGRMAGRTRPFTLIVNRYTSADDVANMNSALRSGGQDALMRVLPRLDAGRIAVGTGVGVTANAVIATPTAEGGTKLMVLYQRTVSFYELRYGARSEDYRVGYAEIYLDRRGQGHGTFIPAAKVKPGGDTWVVEDFGEFPARLLGLRSRGSVVGAR